MVENKSAEKIKTRKFVFAVAVISLVLGLAAVWYTSYMGKLTKKGFITLHGWVEGTEVTLSSKETGNIIKLPLDEGDEVKTKDLIVQIDSEQIKSKLKAAYADIENAKDGLKRAADDVLIFESRVKGAKIALELAKKQSTAKISEAKAVFEATKEHLKQVEYNYVKAEKDFIRFSALFKKKKISQSKMDSVEERYNVTKAAVEQIKNDLDKSRASLSLAKATVTEIELKKNELETLERKYNKSKTEINMAKSKLDSVKAKKNEIAATLDDTYIYSPVKGTLVDKFVEIGEHVVPGTPVVLIIDMNSLYVKSYVEQIHIGKIKYKDIARIYVDSYPDRYFEGKITFIAPKAEFTPRDIQMKEHRSKIVYKVEIGIDNPEGILKPGMPADIYIKWDKDKAWKTGHGNR